MSGDSISGYILTWMDNLIWTWNISQEIVETWLQETWLNVWWFVNNIGITPSSFRLWIRNLIKDIWLWFLHHRYWFVGFVVCYILIIVIYNYVRWKVVYYFQKKWFDEYKQSLENKDD